MSSQETSSIFGPLLFENQSSNGARQLETKCLLCEDSFNLKEFLPAFAVHLHNSHSVIVEDIQKIHNLPEYILYWRQKFKTVPLQQVIPSVAVGEKRYFMLSTLLQEDKELRHKLRLEHALKLQEFERNDKGYVKGCLFCSLQYEGSRQGYLQHLLEQHHLVLGNPQNLVYIEELVEKIETKLNDLKCIYCEKTFPDRKILKEHMRKKLHKTVNADNKEYDKFYIVNYLEEDKDWQEIQKEDDRFPLPYGNHNSDEEYSDWLESNAQITCLFCHKTESDIGDLLVHMNKHHGFDFTSETKELDFYQKVKLVNYIRKQVYDKTCPYCEEDHRHSYRLESHMFEKGHCKVPELKKFNQPEFYFPTYENDALLYFIDDAD